MLPTRQEVELYRLPSLELVKDEMIDFAVGRLSAYVASRRSDETVAAELRVVEPLVEIAGLSDVEYLAIVDEQVNA